MYEIQAEGAFYRLSDSTSRVTAAIAPHRGALLTELTLEGRSVIYFSQENYDSDERPRCGMPVLFPVCGRSTDEKVLLKGREYPMPIHGFAHTSPWQVREARADDTGAFLTLELTDTAATREYFPYAFCLRLTFGLTEGVLTVSHLCVNRDPEPMPFDFGYHPYFQISAPENAAVTLPGQLPLYLPDGPETGAFFPGHHSPVTLLDSELGCGAEVGCDGQFNQMLLWGIPEKKFLCVEPWRANPDGLNKGTTVVLAPGQQNTGVVTMRPICQQ